MLDKNPGTLRTSSGQGMGQRFSMCTHTKYITHMISKPLENQKSCDSIIRYEEFEKLPAFLCACDGYFFAIWSCGPQRSN